MKLNGVIIEFADCNSIFIGPEDIADMAVAGVDRSLVFDEGEIHEFYTCHSFFIELTPTAIFYIPGEDCQSLIQPTDIASVSGALKVILLCEDEDYEIQMPWGEERSLQNDLQRWETGDDGRMMLVISTAFYEYDIDSSEEYTPLYN